MNLLEVMAKAFYYTQHSHSNPVMSQLFQKWEDLEDMDMVKRDCRILAKRMMNILKEEGAILYDATKNKTVLILEDEAFEVKDEKKLEKLVAVEEERFEQRVAAHVPQTDSRDKEGEYDASL